MIKNFYLKLGIMLMLFLSSSLGFKARAQLVQVGTGTTYSGVSPINSCYVYNYTQQIYTAAEIIAANGNTTPVGTINNLRFHINTASYNSGTANFNNWKVYIGFVAQGDFTSNTNWVPLASLTQVYSGVLTFPANGNWLDIPLSTQLAWNGTSNIVVAIHEEVPGYDCTMQWTSTSTSPTYRTIYYYNDSNNPNPASPPSASGRSYTRPNIQFNFVAPCNASTVYPASATTTATPGSSCFGTNVAFTLNPVSAMPNVSGLTYQLQYATALAGPYSNVAGAVSSTTTINYAPANSGYYRIQVLCGSTPTSLASSGVNITVDNPQLASTAGATRCGPGTLSLNATASGSYTVNWYTNPTGGQPIFTGSNFTTPYLSSTTTYYAAASTPPNQINATIGTGTGSTGGSSYVPGPFSIYYRRTTMQLLYTAAEITAAGGTRGNITSLAFNCTGVPAYAIPNYTIRIATVPSTMTTLTWQPMANFTQVYNNASYTPTTGWQTINFGTPFPWNGTDNIVIYICWDQAQPSYSSTGNHQFTTKSGRFLYTWTDGTGTSCGETGTSTSTDVPNIRFGISASCEGARTAVTATVNTSPRITAAYDSVVCNSAITSFNITSALNNYTTYNWAYIGAGTGTLYTDPQASTPYSGTSLTTLYFKSSVPGLHRVVINGNNPTTGCATSDTFRIFVNPDAGSFAITGDKDTLCQSGISSINVSNAAYLKPGFYTWYQSDNGTTYTSMATPALPFNTATLTAHKYYRIVVRNSNNQSCDTINKTIYVANPAIISTVNGSHCGPGQVQLEAYGNPGESVLWFESQSSATPIFTGNVFTTPYLANNTTYYAQPSVGSSISNVQIGTGTATSGTTSAGPYNIYYRSSTVQMMYTAAEIIAAGGQAGNIMSMAFNCIQPPEYSLPNYTLRIATVPSAMTTLTWQPAANFTQVYANASYMPGTGWQTITFNTPFAWNGSDNIVINVCWDMVPAYSSTGGTHQYTSISNRMLYSWSDVSNMCPSTGSSTSNLLPNLKLVIESGCKGTRVPVDATILEIPEVNLGGDINKCVDQGHMEFLNARNAGANYTWDNNYNGQVRVINSSGTYWVTVTNTSGCSSSDTVSVQFNYNPVSELGNDTTTCLRTPLTLDAGGNGIQYFWNTGATTRSINVNQSGQYIVFITAENGCTTQDTINVTQRGNTPSHDGIWVRNINPNTFNFTLTNPQNVGSVRWDFGDGSPYSFQMNPTHTYNSNGHYIVRIITYSSCGSALDTTAVHIKGLDISDISTQQLIKLYPNPASDVVTVEADKVMIQSIHIVDATGRIVDAIPNLNTASVRVNTEKLASGMYYIIINTNTGQVQKKLDIIGKHP